jgi:hypothetical protein
MASQSTPRRLNRLARCLKFIGKLTDPTATRSGKLFTKVETSLTKMMERLSHNETYLHLAGRMMEQSFLVQTEAVRTREALLHAMRLPTASELIEVRHQLRHVSDEVEALSMQIELVLERLEELQNTKAG